MATKLRDLMLLATDLQSSSIGLTKMQLIERCKERGFEPSKRTIERWLVDLEELGMETKLTEVETDHPEKIKFHPSQHLVWQKDNSLKMYFKCKGWKELIHELLHPDWQGELKIVSPKEFKDAVKDYLKESKGLI